jgi:RNA polymerase sigma-70 factor (ECF subfamily)
MVGPLERIYERVLVLRCQAGDEAAFAELVGRYAGRLRYYLRRLLDAGEPDDVLQEVWLDVFRGLPRLADAGAFPAWLYRVARDRALRSRRGRRPPVALPDGDWPDEPDEGLAAEDAARVHAALAELPPEQREVLVLRFLEEMAYDDIARVIDAPLGTVRSRLYYAKLALRRILERREERG